MFEFFRNLFAPERSSETAKERLKLVLLSDHLSLAPDTVEALKRDLLEVISRYVEIDAGHADVTFEQRPHEVAMLASIPITGVRERPAQSPAPSLAAPIAATIEPVQVAEATSDAPSEASTSDEAGAEAAVTDSPAPVPARSANAGAPRRRRRKKSAAARALAQAQHGPPAPVQSMPGVGSA